MKAGIINEPSGENRVALLPEAVKELVSLKVDVIVEKNSGVRAFAADKDYEEAGARLTSRNDVLKESDVIFTISPLEPETIEKLNEKQVIIGGLNPLVNHSALEVFVKKDITTFSLDVIPRTTRAQAMDILSSMATIAGYKSILDAAGRLPRFFPMFMSAAGTIKPAKVLILGAGVAGLQAVATSRKLGAVVEVFDVRAAVKEEVQSLGGKFIEVEGARDDASAGGYAIEQTEEFKQKQRELIHEHASKADVIICTAQIPGKKAPLLITKQTVENMRAGSLIIDLAASTGGNCELTKNKEVVVHNHVSIIGKSDFPSDMPSDASKMFGKNIMNFMKLIVAEDGALNLDFEDEIVKGTCVTYNKEIVHERVKQVLNT